jgi:hypothetical protein
MTSDSYLKADKPLINPDKPARVFETDKESKLGFEIEEGMVS